MTTKQKARLYWHAYFAMDASLRDDERAYQSRKKRIAKCMAGLTPLAKAEAKRIVRQALEQAERDWKARRGR